MKAGKVARSVITFGSGPLRHLVELGELVASRFDDVTGLEDLHECDDAEDDG